MSLYQVLAAHPAAAVSPSDESLRLLEGLRGVAGGRVLILGHGVVELMCSLIRAGSQEVTELRVEDRPEHAQADLVLVPRVTSPEQAAVIAANGRRALVPTGQIMLAMPGHLAAGVIRALKLQGFTAVRQRDDAAGSVVSASLPAFTGWV